VRVVGRTADQGLFGFDRKAEIGAQTVQDLQGIEADS
jgi:hypothetical protein